MIGGLIGFMYCQSAINFNRQAEALSRANEAMSRQAEAARNAHEKSIRENDAYVIDGECSVIEVKLIGSGSGD